MNKKAQSPSFMQIFTKFAFLALFFVALFSIAFIVQSNNDAPQSLSEESLFNNTFNSLKEQIDTSESSSKTQRGVFDEETPNPGVAGIVLNAIVGIGKTMTSLVDGFFTVLIKIPMVVLGIDSIIISTILSVLILTLIIGAWALYKIGGL